MNITGFQTEILTSLVEMYNSLQHMCRSIRYLIYVLLNVSSFLSVVLHADTFEPVFNADIMCAGNDTCQFRGFQHLPIYNVGFRFLRYGDNKQVLMCSCACTLSAYVASPICVLPHIFHK